MASRTALKPRQEVFCDLIVEGRSQKDAYIDAGYTARGNAAEVEASKMVRLPKVADRLAELQAKAARRSEITVDSLVAELDEMFHLAVECESPSAGVAAVMGKAKLLGLIIDRAQVESTIRKPAREATDKRQMSLEEWQKRFAPN